MQIAQICVQIRFVNEKIDEFSGAAAGTVIHGIVRIASKIYAEVCKHRIEILAFRPDAGIGFARVREPEAEAVRINISAAAYELEAGLKLIAVAEVAENVARVDVVELEDIVDHFLLDIQ